MSITGQVGHIAVAKQTAFGTPNTTAGQYKNVKITGDSLVAGNNMLVAEGEIGQGRDVSAAIPGGFSAAGAVNGNLRARAAAVFLNGALGSLTAVAAAPPAAAFDEFTPADALPVFTVEKKIGTDVRSANELTTIRYTNTMVNTLNLTIPSGGFATFSAGLIATDENYISAPVVTDESVPATSDDVLAFHGGRIRAKDSTNADTVSFVAGDNDSTFQSVEVVINNNVQADEYTVRPSRFLRSLTEGIRAVEVNLTIVFENYATYQKYTYGATGRTAPGYSLYMGALDLFLGNWQIVDADEFSTASATGAPTNPQAVHIVLPKLAFSGLPVALASGRIAVSTTARALKPATGNIVKAHVRPTAAGF